MIEKLKSISRLWKNRSGVAAVEFAMVAPMLMALLLGSMEAGMLFQLKNSMTFQTRDMARAVALGNLEADEAEALLLARLTDYADLSYSVSIDPADPDDDNDNDVVVRVSLAKDVVQDYAITGVLVLDDLVTTATMRSVE